MWITRAENEKGICISLMKVGDYNAVVREDGDWWIGWIEEIPGVNCQERTKEELMESLKVTLEEALEFSR